MKTTLVLTVLLAFLGAAVLWAVYVWTSVGYVPISGNGITALVLMIVFSLIIGCGLMVLLFYSSRSGYDEPPEIDTDPEQHPRPDA
ncbi:MULTISPECIES: hypothetical protein [Rhodomicrobium]|uniref:hypothetical protein n=1 Tax=Rhodomicrobium TaxID=1068 RepID=UPI000B4B00AC|nr:MULTISPECIES: hypothetical protein [Rhodomicrobium]